jgi:hypothetical protein
MLQNETISNLFSRLLLRVILQGQIPYNDNITKSVYLYAASLTL